MHQSAAGNTHRITRSGGQERKTKSKQTRKRRTIKVVPSEKTVLSIDEAADDSGLSRTELYRHLDKIGSIKVGRRRLIIRDRLHEWLRSLPHS